MFIADNIAELHRVLTVWHNQGDSIALVPTMGNLHAGHMRLVHEARKCAKRVVVSIFVNPLQFNDPNDFTRYPRTFAEDQIALAAAKTDLLFTPGAEEIYPLGDVTRVHVPGLSEMLCGAFRPGHFIGVTTVVNKLFNMVQPDVALFGLKDFQQFTIIHRMLLDLHMPVELVGIETVRETDGLAMSSRNSLLSADERQRAPAMYRALCAARDAVSKGEVEIAALEQHGMQALEQAGFKPEYFTLRRAVDLQPDDGSAHELVILAAAWLGNTRLIDNVTVTNAGDN